MLNKIKNMETKMTNTIKLTDKETQVLTSIYKFTFRENGYDDKDLKAADLDGLIEDARAYVDALDLSIMPAISDMSMKSIGGVLTSLQEKGLIYADEDVESVQEHKGLMQFVIQPSGVETVWGNK
tara:strand:- start:99 stop:473 length:375 start_codon:yes stop_codon:yes gene_type:complete